MPRLANTPTVKTNNQPTIRPNSLRTISCIMNSDTIPSDKPVHENQSNNKTSNHIGICSLGTPRCLRSVKIYGAFGKNNNHNTAANGITNKSVLRFHEKEFAAYAIPKGIHARKIFQIKKV